MTDMNLNDLDETLDDLADLPQQKPFPPGAHRAKVSLIKSTKKAGAYTAKFVYIETLEFANPADAESEDRPKPDDEALMFFNTKKKDGTPNEIGQGQLKQVAAPLGQLFGTGSVNEICQQSKDGVEVIIVSGVKSDKEYGDKMTLTNIQVA